MGFGRALYGITDYDYEYVIEKYFKITYYIHTSPSDLDVYISDDVCAYECSRGGWGTSTNGINGNPYEPLRRLIFTQCRQCRAFNENDYYWI